MAFRRFFEALNRVEVILEHSKCGPWPRPQCG